MCVIGGAYRTLEMLDAQEKEIGMPDDLAMFSCQSDKN
jgi:hypothetical protein